MKKRDTLGLDLPEKLKAEVITLRLKGVEARKFDRLAKKLKVGRSSLARIVIEKFIKDHDPER